MTPRFTLTARCDRCFAPLPKIDAIGAVVAVCESCGETWIIEVRSEPMSTRAVAVESASPALLPAPPNGYHPLIGMIHQAIAEDPSLGANRVRKHAA